MRATFALLTDTRIHNLVRKLSWDIHQRYRIGIDVCRLPPHISLKQPFEVANLDSLENYMDELAKSIKPFRVNLNRLELIETNIDDRDTGILWMGVVETEFLRRLHTRVNEELNLRFGNTSADFDGPQYHFHMTVAIGGQPLETYRKIHGEYSDRLVDLHCTVQKLAMFVYDDRNALNAGYMIYRVLPLGSSEIKRPREVMS